MPRREKAGPLTEAIGARIRQLREEIGITQEKLAYESGLQSKGFLSDVEKGLALPSLETLQLLAERLEVELFDLLVFPQKGGRHVVVDLSRRLTANELTRLASDLSPV